MLSSSAASWPLTAVTSDEAHVLGRSGYMLLYVFIVSGTLCIMFKIIVVIIIILINVIILLLFVVVVVVVVVVALV